MNEAEPKKEHNPEYIKAMRESNFLIPYKPELLQEEKVRLDLMIKDATLPEDIRKIKSAELAALNCYESVMNS